MSKILDFLVLPRTVSAFEVSYLRGLNRIAVGFLAAHVPVFTLVAWANHTGPLTALALTLLVLVGPVIAWIGLKNPRSMGMVAGVAAMCMGGLLVHFGQGPVQIEMHFYFFAVVAMLAVFANPMVIVAASGTVALHHLLVWLAVPKSVFNYDASVWVVGLHAAFLVLESVATCFIARSFFDNIIGLEKVVAARTSALVRATQDMRLVLDNVRQGFVTIDRTGKLASERSSAFTSWFGAAAVEATIFDLLATRAPDFASRSLMYWDEVRAGIMPLELTLDQMPAVMTWDDVEMSIEYRAIGDSETPSSFLVVITDVSADRQRDRADTERREGLKLFERLISDRTGCASFFEESSEQVASITGSALDGDIATYKRVLHTLKGNSAIFGLQSVAELCHVLESSIDDEQRLPDAAQRETLAGRWGRLALEMDRLLGARRDVIEIEQLEHQMLEQAIRRGIPQDALLRQVHELKLDSTQRRLDGFADQAKRIAERLGKGDIEVVVEANGLRVDAAHWAPFWSAFVHALRNAVDHGLEHLEERASAGKDPTGHLALRTLTDGTSFIVEIEDDGRGIDWKKLTAKAESMGITGMIAKELLFADGLSTADEVTELSGRGVGLGALRATTLALGGTLDVTSRIGAGTKLRMVFPEGARMPDLHADGRLPKAA